MTTVALTIAGSDSGGGAGIQADLKTFQELGVFGTSALTAVTAQNTMGVHGVYPLHADDIVAQMKAVMDDFQVNAIKTGMLFSAEIIEAVASTLTLYGPPPLIIDPVMIAKGGAALLQQEAVEAMKHHLLPMATLLTPNIPEAEVLAGIDIREDQDVVEAGKRILDLGATAVIMKGGHRKIGTFAEDLFLSTKGESFRMRSEWINTKDTHGTGCTFSAAITAEVAKGSTLREAVVTAKHFIQAAITDSIALGNGHGPTNHWAFQQQGGALRKDVVIIDEK